MSKLYGQMKKLCCRAIDVTHADPEAVLAALYDNASPPTDLCELHYRPGPLSQDEICHELLDDPEERIEYIFGRFMGKLDLFTGYLCARHWDEHYPRSMWTILRDIKGCRLMLPVIRACAAECAPHRVSMKAWPHYGGDDARRKPRSPPWKQYQDLLASGYRPKPESERRPLTGIPREPLPELENTNG